MPKTKMKTIKFQVEAGNILIEAIEHFSRGNNTVPGMAQGLDMIRGGLARIAQRAIELQDEALLDVCINLCIVRPSGEVD